MFFCKLFVISFIILQVELNCRLKYTFQSKCYIFDHKCPKQWPLSKKMSGCTFTLISNSHVCPVYVCKKMIALTTLAATQMPKSKPKIKAKKPKAKAKKPKAKAKKPKANLKPKPKPKLMFKSNSMMDAQLKTKSKTISPYIESSTTTEYWLYKRHLELLRRRHTTTTTKATTNWFWKEYFLTKTTVNVFKHPLYIYVYINIYYISIF